MTSYGDCEFIDGVCKWCRQPSGYGPNADVVRSCPRAELQLVAAAVAGDSRWRLALRFALALVRWFRAWCARRSQREIDRIFKICQACPHFTRSSGICGKCGCGCSASPSALKNKIAMASEHCPDDPPRW